MRENCVENALKLCAICTIFASCAQIELKNCEKFARKCIVVAMKSFFYSFVGLIAILLTIAVSVASCEWYFSKLKLILTYLRASTPCDKITLGICAAQH